MTTAKPSVEGGEERAGGMSDEGQTLQVAPRGAPFGVTIGLVVGLALIDVARGPLRDIDLYWHILIGEQIAATPFEPQEMLGGWEILPRYEQWVSTQWLAEWLFFALHEFGSWSAIAAFRVLSAAVAMLILAGVALRGRPLALAGWPFVAAVLSIAVGSQERSQQITYIGAAVLGGVLVSGLAGGRVPRWWLLLPSTVLWANLHGGWVLVPATLVLVGVGHVLDGGLRGSRAVPWIVMALAASAAGIISPSGFANLTAVLRISGAASDAIVEWQATEPLSRGGLTVVLFLLLILIAWSRGGQIPASEVLSTVALLGLALSSWRNVTPALILLAPLLSHQLVRAFPEIGRAPEPRWSPRWGIVLAVLLGSVALLSTARASHLPSDKYPFELATALEELPGETRVLNSYNVAGVSLLFGGDDILVGIDGRTEYWGADYIRDYQEMIGLRGNWERLFSALRPTAALVEEDSAIAFELIENRQWYKVGTENEFVLLVPDASGGSS